MPGDPFFPYFSYHHQPGGCPSALMFVIQFHQSAVHLVGMFPIYLAPGRCQLKRQVPGNAIVLTVRRPNQPDRVGAYLTSFRSRSPRETISASDTHSGAKTSLAVIRPQREQGNMVFSRSVVPGMGAGGERLAPPGCLPACSISASAIC